MVRKAWDYEKSIPGAQIEPTAWAILQFVVSLNEAIVLAVPLWVLRNLMKYLHSQFSNSKCCGRNYQSLNAIKHGSSRPEVFCKNGVLRNFAKFTGKHLCQSFFFNKTAGLRPATLLKKRLWHRCFSVAVIFFVNFGSGGYFWKQSLLSFRLEKLHKIECLVFLAYSWLK